MATKKKVTVEEKVTNIVETGTSAGFAVLGINEDGLPILIDFARTEGLAERVAQDYQAAE